MKHAFINGIKIYIPKSKNEFLDYIFHKKQILIAINAEKILQSKSETRDLINRNLGYPDGIGAVWALKRLGIKNVIKIPGVELWLEIIKKFSHTKSFYLIGGEKEVIEETVICLKKEFKGIDILNYRDGYIKSEKEKNELISDIVFRKPDIVFVAMGSPKQELLMQEISNIHQALYQGLGGSFDVYIGNVLRAPKWWVNNNLEWAYRLFKQPKRIKRQIYLFKFLVKLALNRY